MFMGTIQIVEDCLAPARFVYLTYSGKSPFAVASKIAEMLQPFFRVSSAGISETDFRWDETGDPVQFYFTWWVERDDELSRWSQQRFNIMVQGNQTKETKEGEFTLRVDARLNTKFEFSNPFLKMFFWLYDYIFYFRRRSEFLKECEELVYEFRDELKEHFNLQVLDKSE
jgi:hypothetical protein